MVIFNVIFMRCDVFFPEALRIPKPEVKRLNYYNAGIKKQIPLPVVLTKTFLDGSFATLQALANSLGFY